MSESQTPQPKRRFTLRIRTMMLVIFAICGVLGFVVVPAETQRNTVRKLRSFDVKVELADSPTDPFPSFLSGNEFEEPDWFTRWCHETFPAEYLRKVTQVTIKGEQVSDVAIARLIAELSPGSKLSFEGDVGVDSMRVIADANNLEGVHFYSGSTVSADVLRHVARMRNLKSLCIFEVEIELGGLNHLKQLDGLEILFLRCSKVDDQSLSFLSGLRSLNWFEIESPNVNGNGLRHLAGLELMERMELSGLPLEDAEVEFLKTMPRLRYLNLADTNVTDTALHFLANATGLSSLDLTATGVEGHGIEHLRNCVKLWSLNLSKSRFASSSGLAGLEGVEYISLSDTAIEDEDVEGLSLPNLVYFGVSNTEVTAKGLRAFASRNPTLKWIATDGLKMSKEELQNLSAEIPRVDFDY